MARLVFRQLGRFWLRSQSWASLGFKGSLMLDCAVVLISNWTLRSFSDQVSSSKYRPLLISTPRIVVFSTPGTREYSWSSSCFWAWTDPGRHGCWPAASRCLVMSTQFRPWLALQSLSDLVSFELSQGWPLLYALPSTPLALRFITALRYPPTCRLEQPVRSHYCLIRSQGLRCATWAEKQGLRSLAHFETVLIHQFE